MNMNSSDDDDDIIVRHDSDEEDAGEGNLETPASLAFWSNLAGISEFFVACDAAITDENAVHR